MMHPVRSDQAVRPSRVRPSFFVLILAGLLLPTATPAQQSTSSYNFGSLAIGASATQSLTLTIPSSATLGGIAVSTQGVANLDFTNGGGSCAVGTAYAASATCTVSVNFTPKLAGTRYGAVVLSDDSGNVIATDYLQGSGTGPQVNFLPGTESTVGSGFDEVGDLIVDGSGNLYITDINNSRVLKETWTGTGYTQSTFLSEPNVPSPTGVDGAGNLYMSSDSLNQVQKWTWTGSGYVQTTIGSGLYIPTSAVADGAGNVYIADAFNGRVLKETLSAGSYTQSVILTCGVYGVHVCPSSVAVDGSGNVYVSAWQSSSTFDSSKILKMTPSAGGYTQSTIGSGMNWANMVVVDGSGNLFVADDNNSRILRETLSVGSYIQSTVTTSALEGIYGVAVDGSGNVYIANTFYNQVLREDLTDEPSLSFASTPVGSTSSDSPKTVQIENVGTATLDFTAVSYPADFPETSGDASACTDSTSLSAGLMCDVPVESTPEHGGALSEDVTITDNALNVAGAQQSIGVSGTGVSTTAATHFSVTTTASVVAGTSFSIMVTALNSSNKTASSYDGTVAFTSSDPGFVNPGPLTLSSGIGQATVTLETVGMQTITATDATTSSLTGSGIFTVAPVTEALTSPTPGTVLAGPSVTFTWTAGTGVTGYGLWLGLNGAGSSDLYVSGWTTATSASANNLPTKGAKVYARLFWKIGTASHTYYADYTYTEATSTLAAMISPVAGSTLGASNVQFTWSAGTFVTNYALWVGISGPGSSDVYVSGPLTATSTTVTSIPTKGATIYARLFSDIGGHYLYTDYVYTEGTSIPAALTSPTPGSTLGTSNVVFSWTAGTFVTNYALWLGINGPGSSDVYVLGWTTATSATVTSLPARGAKIYARLFSKAGSATLYNDYTYTEQ